MKIAVLSFDLWGYNEKIVQEFKKQGHEVIHIDSSKINFKYKNYLQRVSNFFSKIIFKRNIKKIRKKEILNYQLNKLSTQNIILIINPGNFGEKLCKTARNKTHKLIAFNNDSIARVPLPKNYKLLFDTVFSFDLHDVKNFNLTLLTNYNYINLHSESETGLIMSAFTVQSKGKDRIYTLSKIADAFDNCTIKDYEFYVKDFRKKNKSINKNIRFLEGKTMTIAQIENKTKQAHILLDLVRKNQTGLSFRFFEAMAYEKKIITTNAAVKTYDFYNDNNIFVIDVKNPIIKKEFIDTPYKKLPDVIFYKYTITNFCKTILKA